MPDPSFARGRPPGGGAGGFNKGGKGPPSDAGKGAPPREAMDACNGKAEGATCSFSGRQGEALSGTCFVPPGGNMPLACRPERGGAGKR